MSLGSSPHRQPLISQPFTRLEVPRRRSSQFLIITPSLAPCAHLSPALSTRTMCSTSFTVLASTQGTSLKFSLQDYMSLTCIFSYWDFSVSEEYSYVRASADAGITTFRYDRLGTGLSEKPSDSYKYVLFKSRC